MRRDGGDRASFWRQHLDGWRTSGLTQQEYCRQHGLKFSTLARYRNRINRERKAPVQSFIPIAIKAESEGLNKGVFDPIEIRLRNGRCLAVADAFDEAKLGRLVRLLETLPC